MLQLISFPFIFELVRRSSHLDEICECFRWLKCQEFVLLLTFGVLAALWLNFLHVCLLIMIYSQCRLSFVLFRCAHLSLFMVIFVIIRMWEHSALCVNPTEFSLPILFIVYVTLDISSYPLFLLFAGEGSVPNHAFTGWMLSLKYFSCLSYFVCEMFIYFIIFFTLWIATLTIDFPHLSFRTRILLYLIVYLLTLLIFCVNALRRCGWS